MPDRHSLYQLSIVLLALQLAACAVMPTADTIRASRAVPEGKQPRGTDARSRFRGIFCQLARDAGATAEPHCDSLLWRLADEPVAEALAVLPPLHPHLHIIVVGGAFSDCFGTASQAWHTGIEHLRGLGIDARATPISSRSSAAYNARILEQTLEEAALGLQDEVMLVGYSKGTVDILQFLVDYPQQARLVDAVVNVAGPVWGSIVAEKGAWAYDTFFADSFAGLCPPGDGGFVDSLLPEVRERWMGQHTLPRHVRFYSLLGIAGRQHLARGLRSTWSMLAHEDPRNDGQVTPREGWLPGSALLGFANADHWGLAIDIEQALPAFTWRPDNTPYPRDILFEALARFVGEDLARTAPAGN